MLLSDKVIVLNNKIKSISLKNIKQKVADYILQEYKSQKQLIVNLKMNKEEIANFIGIPRPSLSRELIKLRKEKIIDFDRNNITILDIDKLEEILFHWKNENKLCNKCYIFYFNYSVLYSIYFEN